MTTINTIIFDLGAVLINWDPFPVILKTFNGDEDKARWFLKNVCTHDWNASLDKGKTFEAAKIEKLAEFPAYEKSIIAYLDDWEEMLQGEITGTVEILKKLKDAQKYRLLSITNWSFETFPIARKTFPFLSWFEDIVVSGEVNMVKPDRDIYEYAIKRFELADTSSAVFIDDRLENIETAQSLGLHGIHFKHPAQFAEELLALGIE